jgi:hypothetical protein
MTRTEPWRWSATRVEIDQRSREARLRAEQSERLLLRRALPRRSWLMQIIGSGRVLSAAGAGEANR